MKEYNLKIKILTLRDFIDNNQFKDFSKNS
jgi:hypothetical protein